jgi:hypothetical protein
MMLIYSTDDMESMVELMVMYVGRDVCGGRWAGLVVRGFVLNVPICNRTLEPDQTGGTAFKREAVREQCGARFNI